MYEVYADSICVFSDTSPDKIFKAAYPKLNLSAGASGVLTLTLPKVNAGYNSVERLTSTFKVLRDGEEIWRGRMLSESKDMWGNRALTCEGALSFLNDTIQPEQTISGTATSVLTSLLSTHNGKVATNRQIEVGTVGMSGNVVAKTSHNKTFEAITNLAETYGGILRTRVSSGTVYLDWLENYPASTGNEQKIEFGSNLLDFTRSWNNSEFCTAVLARGALDEDIEDYIYSGWITNDSAIANYGRIERYLSYDDIDSQSDLIAEAQKFLSSSQFDDMTINLTAVDLRLIDDSIQPFSMLDRVRVISYAHGMDRLFAVVGMNIPLDAPESTSYVLGDPNIEKKRKQSLTSLTYESNVKTAEATGRTGLSVKTSDKQVKRLSKGHIFLYTTSSGVEEIYFLDVAVKSYAYISYLCQNIWKWGFDGLKFSPDAGSNWTTAISQDGKINADLILTGKMRSDRLKLYGDNDLFASAAATAASGGVGYGAGKDGYDSTSGVHFFVGTNEVFVSSAGARISCADKRIKVTSSGVEISSGAAGGTCNLHVDGNITASGSITGNVT